MRLTGEKRHSSLLCIVKATRTNCSSTAPIKLTCCFFHTGQTIICTVGHQRKATSANGPPTSLTSVHWSLFGIWFPGEEARKLYVNADRWKPVSNISSSQILQSPQWGCNSNRDSVQVHLWSGCVSISWDIELRFLRFVLVTVHDEVVHVCGCCARAPSSNSNGDWQ